MKKGIILLIALVILGISIYFITKNDTKTDDNIKFKSEYSTVSSENLFVYRSAEEIIKILEKGTGIVYLGFPECPWCQAYVPLLNEIATEIGIKKIYYFNIKNDRSNDTDNYKKIVDLLSGNLLYNDEGNERIYVPDVTIVKNGQIIGHNNETSVVTTEDGTPEQYWTEERKIELKNALKEDILKIKDTSCHEVCDK